LLSYLPDNFILILIQNIKHQFRWISTCDEREGSQHCCHVKKTFYQKIMFRGWEFILESALPPELVLPPKATILPSARNPTKPGHTPKSAEPPNGPDGRGAKIKVLVSLSSKCQEQVRIPPFIPSRAFLVDNDKVELPNKRRRCKSMYFGESL
jgi:hypothetical protein